MRRLAALAVIALAAAAAAPARAAAPRYIVVSGPGLAKPVLLGDWNENLMLLSSLVNAKHLPARVTRGRPRFHLALFWDVRAKPIPTTGGGASQGGWFYPATRRLPAVFDLLLNGARYGRLATPQALHILRRHGVPVRTRR